MLGEAGARAHRANLSRRPPLRRASHPRRGVGRPNRGEAARPTGRLPGSPGATGAVHPLGPCARPGAGAGRVPRPAAGPGQPPEPQRPVGPRVHPRRRPAARGVRRADPGAVLPRGAAVGGRPAAPAPTSGSATAARWTSRPGSCPPAAGCCCTSAPSTRPARSAWTGSRSAATRAATCPSPATSPTPSAAATASSRSTSATSPTGSSTPPASNGWRAAASGTPPSRASGRRSGSRRSRPCTSPASTWCRTSPTAASR